MRGERQPAFEFARPPAGRVDHCGCPKPPGMWGEKGWHMMVADELWLRQQVRQDLAALPEYAGEEDLLRVEAAARERWSRHLGEQLIVERCPAYAAACARNAASRKALLRSLGRGRRR